MTNCEGNIRRIVDRSLDLGATIILTTIFPIGEIPVERRPFWSDEVEQSINEVNTFIRSLASEKVIILDAYSVLHGAKGKIKPEYAMISCILQMQAISGSMLNSCHYFKK